MKVLVTGAAGFIGSKIMYLLAQRGDEVVGIDNLNTYYDIRMKSARLSACGFLPSRANDALSSRANDALPSGAPAALSSGAPAALSSGAPAALSSGAPAALSSGAPAALPSGASAAFPSGAQVSRRFPNCRFIKMDICAKESIDRLFAQEKFDAVLHFAAQAGVRYSIDHPYDFLDSNIYGFLNILEACRHHPVRHLVYASSSSVYGLNTKSPNAETDQVDTPVSLYGATKKSAELMAHSYAKLYRIPVTGLRFFSVYGPWGRPDMSPMLFAHAIRTGQPIKVFNHGDMSRDFTYIDDVAEAVLRTLDHIPGTPASDTPSASAAAIAGAIAGAPASGTPVPASTTASDAAGATIGTSGAAIAGAPASGAASAAPAGTAASDTPSASGAAIAGAPASGANATSAGAAASTASADIPYRIYNVGCSHPVRLMDFISELENALGQKAEKIYLPMQAGDVYQTYADTTLLEREIGFKPSITLHEGIRRFIDWYLSPSNPLL